MLVISIFICLIRDLIMHKKHQYARLSIVVVRYRLNGYRSCPTTVTQKLINKNTKRPQ